MEGIYFEMATVEGETIDTLARPVENSTHFRCA